MESLGHLYIVDFLKSMGQRKNIFSVIYLLINVAIIFTIFNYVIGNWPKALLYAIVLYSIAICIALSPVGEWILRLLNGCKKIKDPMLLNRLEPLFMEVKERSKTKHSDFLIDDNINLYIKEDEEVNAFAVGRKTVCVTTGLLSLTDEEIKGVLGHEFGHLATHDSDLLLVIVVGNLIVTAIVSVIKFIITITRIMMAILGSLIGGSEGAIVGIINAIAGLLTFIAVDGVMFVWTHLGVLLTMKTSREAEYQADAFSADLGYMDGLLTFFSRYDENSKGTDHGVDIFAALSSSHPTMRQRIEKLTKYANVA